MPFNWNILDPNSAGQGNAFSGRLPSLLSMPPLSGMGTPATPTPMQPQHGVGAPNPPLVPQSPQFKQPPWWLNLIATNDTIDNWYGYGPRQARQISLQGARNKLISAVKRQQRIESILEKEPNNRKEELEEAMIRGDIEPDQFKALYPSESVKPTNTAKLVNEIWGVKPGDPEYPQKALQLIKLHNPGQESRAEWSNPISPSELGNWINKDGETPPPGTNPLIASAQGYEYTTQSDRDKIRTKAGATRTVTNIRDLIFGDQGIYAGVSQDKFNLPSETLNSWVQSVSQSDPRYKLYNDHKRGVTGQIARLFEKGALSEGDADRATALIPNLVPSLINPVVDSPEVAARKLDVLERIINGEEGAAEIKIPGFDDVETPKQNTDDVPKGSWYKGQDGVWYQK